MRELTVSLSERSYQITIGQGLLARTDFIAAKLAEPRIMIVTNETVGPLFLDPLVSSLKAATVETNSVVLKDGESHKNGETLNRIYDALLNSRCDRKTTVLALGGGVIGDLAGFAAATYLRGVPFIQIPTTLVAQVDSSIGGKTAIDLPFGKNLLGTFYQPTAVFADLNLLETLPEKEFNNGLAEVIKYGIIDDEKMFHVLETSMEAIKLIGCRHIR